jgi:hypothetical protein
MKKMFTLLILLTSSISLASNEAVFEFTDLTESECWMKAKNIENNLSNASQLMKLSHDGVVLGRFTDSYDQGYGSGSTGGMYRVPSHCKLQIVLQSNQATLEEYYYIGDYIKNNKNANNALNMTYSEVHNQIYPKSYNGKDLTLIDTASTETKGIFGNKVRLIVRFLKIVKK